MEDKKKPKTYYEYQNEHLKEHYDRINLLVPKGSKELIKDAAEQENLFNKAGRPNLSAYIYHLIKKDMEDKKLI
jgi:hypothetical protein